MVDDEPQGVSRRAMLAGAGLVAGATVLGAALPAGAADEPAPAGKETIPGLEPAAALGPNAVIDFTPGLTYVTIPPTAFTNDNQAGGRSLSTAGAYAVTPANGNTLSAPIVVPVGSAIREIVIAYANPGPPPVDMTAYLFRKGLLATYAQVTSLKLTSLGSTPFGSFIMQVDEVVDGTAAYELSVQMSQTNQAVSGLLVGYRPPARGYVALNPIPRALDTRQAGGKLQANQERVVPLGIPAGAQAAVLNLTVTGTQEAGFVAVFPADAGYPGNSSINWFGPGQNLANTLVTATDASGQVRIRGGVAPTDVVIDVLGYFT